MYDSEEENCSLQSLILKRKRDTGKQKYSIPKLKAKIKRMSPKQIGAKSVMIKNEEIVNNPYGFERKLKAERILGIKKSSKGLMFLIKWQDINEADLVPSEEANFKCPDVVIKFYEDNLYMKTEIDKSTDWIRVIRHNKKS